MKQNTQRTNMINYFILFTLLAFLLITPVKNELNLCTLSESFGVLKDPLNTTDDTCLKTLSTDKVYNYRLDYTYDGYGLTSIKLLVLKNSVMISNLNIFRKIIFPDVVLGFIWN